jgi:RNA polymerase sigma-70 factor (ECF subfamily)
VEYATELAMVLEAMRELPDVDRAALLMRASEEMSYEEIAEALSLPVGTVRVKVHRARLKLMKLRAQPTEITKGESK